MLTKDNAVSENSNEVVKQANSTNQTPMIQGEPMKKLNHTSDDDKYTTE